MKKSGYLYLGSHIKKMEYPLPTSTHPGPQRVVSRGSCGWVPGAGAGAWSGGLESGAVGSEAGG